MALKIPFFKKVCSFLLLCLFLSPSDPARAEASTDGLMVEALRSYDGGDYEAAFNLWAQASDRGDTVAMIAIANMHLQGEGRPKNAQLAVKWYKTAAVKGDVIAQANYGDLLLRGVGVLKNAIEASVWLKLAGEKGNQWAHDQYLKIERTFSRRQKDVALASYLKAKETQK